MIKPERAHSLVQDTAWHVRHGLECQTPVLVRVLEKQNQVIYVFILRNWYVFCGQQVSNL